MEPNTIEAADQQRRTMIAMQGQRVFRWAVGTMPDVCRRALDAAGVSTKDLTAFVPHQANLRITKAITERLGLPESVVVATDIERSGNTSAASIPLAWHALRAEGKVKSGDLALLIGFGAGVTYAAQVARTP